MIEAPRVLDELDQRIILELQEDGRRSFREIGKRVGAAGNTVRLRVSQLIASGLLSITAVPNLAMMGLQFHALVGLKVEPDKVREAAKRLEVDERVAWVALSATGFDVLIEVALRDAQAFGQFRGEALATLPGFVSDEVFVLWDVVKVRSALRPELDPVDDLSATGT